MIYPREDLAGRDSARGPQPEVVVGEGPLPGGEAVSC